MVHSIPDTTLSSTHVEPATPPTAVGQSETNPDKPECSEPKSSPPSARSFRSRVSFDTFDKPADFIEDNSFTLSIKHKNYQYNKYSRTFLCGFDSTDYSEYALEWLIEELIDDGDEIVCLRVVEKDSSLAIDSKSDNRRYRDEAEQVMKDIMAKNSDNKALNLILEFAIGKVNKVIVDMINLYEPSILVVGTRGRSLGGFQGLLSDSVSKFCLQHSPVPVIVVRQNAERAKTKQKRMQDPTRQSYKDLLEKSTLAGRHLLGVSHANSSVGEVQTSTPEEESAAVAAAIGFKAVPIVPVVPIVPRPVASISTQEPERATMPSSSTLPFRERGNVPPEECRSPGVVMKSPDGSDDDDDDDNVSSSTFGQSEDDFPIQNLFFKD